jgi:TetR/AcrR family tetracycline transcriptional repressor
MMARPKIPLISRRKALEAALDIIDTEGLAALSIRRLGEALHVNGASLYHHFKGKDEILVGVTQLALADVTTPRSESDSWRVWLPLNAYRTRQALIAHPQLISIMLRRVPLGIGTAEVEASVSRLQEEGVSLSVIAPLMESFELLAIASALQTVGGASVLESEEATLPVDSVYRQAQVARGLTDDELFEVVCASVIANVESAVHLKEASRASRGGGRGTPTRVPSLRRVAPHAGASKPLAKPTPAKKAAAKKTVATKTGGRTTVAKKSPAKKAVASRGA